MNIKNLLFVIALLLAIPIASNAQVTTSSLTGYVKNEVGEAMVGSTVELVHIPTGTTYRTVSRKGGRYDLVNLIPGGPYKLTISNVGYTPFTESAINLPLGENTRVDGDLASTATSLEGVVVSGTSSSPARKKTGAGTNISNQQINALPTLSRSIQDFTRLTPQANGNSFAGANNRFNNITIDGAVNNDVFGLSGSGTPGG
ncbi:MAG TPA: hypothetical protein DEU93_04880, partial [Chitinophagaceae bacterium]|nr:hypothetical protein [Chitinophagaceae bacterium]